MKLPVFGCLLVMLALRAPVSAQVGVYGYAPGEQAAKLFTLEAPGPNARVFADEAARERFMSKGLLILYNEQIAEQLEEYRFAAEEAWTLSEIKFEPAENYEDGDAVASVAGHAAKLSDFNVLRLSYAESLAEMQACGFVLTEYQREDGGALIPQRRAVINLYPTAATAGMDDLAEFRQKGAFRNLRPGVFKAYLVMIARALERDRPLNYSCKDPNEQAVKRLKTAKLYIPEYALSDPSSGRILSPEELLGAYPFQYEVVADAELSAMLLDPEARTFYWLDYNGFGAFSLTNGGDADNRFLCVYMAPGQWRLYFAARRAAKRFDAPAPAYFRQLGEAVE